MAKINSAARDILLKMVDRKAEPARAAIAKKVEARKAKSKRVLDAKVAKLCDDLATIVKDTVERVRAAADKHGVFINTAWSRNEEFASLERLLNGDKIHAGYVADNSRLSPRDTETERLEDELAALDAKVESAKEELLLRVALNTDYDSVVKQIDALKF